MLAMMQHQHVLKRAQAEIDSVIGGERLPTFEDKERLPYCNAVFTETMRWGVPVPLGELFLSVLGRALILENGCELYRSSSQTNRRRRI